MDKFNQIDNIGVMTFNLDSRVTETNVGLPYVRYANQHGVIFLNVVRGYSLFRIPC